MKKIRKPNPFHLYIQTKYRMLTTPTKKEKKEKMEKKYGLKYDY